MALFDRGGAAVIIPVEIAPQIGGAKAQNQVLPRLPVEATHHPAGAITEAGEIRAAGLIAKLPHAPGPKAHAMAGCLGRQHGRRHQPRVGKTTDISQLGQPP